MKVAVGGTFNVLHRGHRALLDKAFEKGDEVAVGITSDSYVQERKGHHVPLEKRRRELEEYLGCKGKPWRVEVIEDPVGSAHLDPQLGALVVSPGSEDTGKRINRLRRERSLEPLEIFRVEYVLAEDFLPISSTRILEGEIDREGMLDRPLTVMVGSTNPVKVGAVERVMSLLFRSVEVIPIEVDSGVGGQPWGEETVKGARNRAIVALGQGDLGVGVEAGVFRREDGVYDVQYCAVADRRGWVTVGHGPGFRYPPEVVARLESGETVGEAFQGLFQKGDIGRREGAIGFLTRGALDRQSLTEGAVMAAMVPRVRTELYASPLENDQ
ncbi:MAG: inosine/xanthosine triphosphatase [Methanomassiliicoccales archaeon]